MAQPFRFLTDAEFDALADADRRAYVIRAAEELYRMQCVLSKQTQRLAGKPPEPKKG